TRQSKRESICLCDKPSFAASSRNGSTGHDRSMSSATETVQAGLSFRHEIGFQQIELLVRRFPPQAAVHAAREFLFSRFGPAPLHCPTTQKAETRRTAPHRGAKVHPHH